MNKEKIYEYIKSGITRSFLDIARSLRVKPSQNGDLTKILQELQAERKIYRNQREEYFALEFTKQVSGSFSVASSGKFAFVDYNINPTTNTKESVYVSYENFESAINGDIVNVDIYIEPQINVAIQPKSFGIITEILQRNTSKLLGFLAKNGNFIDFEPIDKKFKHIKFKIEKMDVEANVHDLVYASILGYQGRIVYLAITEVITNKADPKLFVKAFLENFKIPKDFPEDLNPEISKIPSSIEEESTEGRIDLTDELIVTIDGDDTKDFDDAIFVKKLENGNYELGVHIADVSHYVREGSLLDDEALKRGTSIYMADRVVPMLPVELSNGICSLNPNAKRFTLSCVVEIDNKGNTVSTKVFPSIIESKYRLTYKQVNYLYRNDKMLEEWFPNNPNLKNPNFDLKNLEQMLKLSRELSVIMHNFKIKQGYIDFEIPEPKTVFTQEGRVKDIIIEERGISEVLIEDFMVRANEEVAKIFEEKKLPSLFRVHDAPDEEKLSYFGSVLNVLGIKIDIPHSTTEHPITPKLFSGLVNEVRKQRNDDFMNLLFLRTMHKAIYSETNIGHFGLASSSYTHFTSPIRRYPDLIIHRLLRKFIFEKDLKDVEKIKDILPSIGKSNSHSEHYAVEIERGLNSIFHAEYYKNQIGKTYDAQIMNIAKFGFFVEILSKKTDALVHKKSLFDGEYEANENETVLQGPNRKYMVGDFVKIVITDVDLIDGKVDCVLDIFYKDYLNQKVNFRRVNNNSVRK